jgi:DNA-directed RNA polymerase beta' subunit
MGIIPPEYIDLIMNKESSVVPDNSPVNLSMTGPESIAAAVDTFTVEDIENEAVELLQAGTKTKRPLATRLLRYVKGFRRNKINPSDYIIRNVPVIPPKFRPFNVVGDSFVPGAANELYRDLFSVLKTHNDVEKVLGRS